MSDEAVQTAGASSTRDYNETQAAYASPAKGRWHASAGGVRPYDCTTMAISPRYAPESADFIIDIFREYITE